MLIKDRVLRAIRSVDLGADEAAKLREAVQREITEAVAEERIRMRSEKVVAMSEEDAVRYRVISELASDWVYAVRIDENGSIKMEWATEAFTQITGYSIHEVNELLGGYDALIHPDDVDGWIRPEEPILRGEPTVLEYRLLMRSGDLRWFRDYARPELDKDGRVVRIFGAAKDVTAEKNAQESLRDALVQLEERVGMEGARFRAVLDAAGDAIFVVDPKTGALIDVNETACRSLGYRRRELLALTLGDVHDQGVPLAKEDWHELELRGGGLAYEGLHRRKDGSTFPVEVTVSLKRFIGRDYLLAVARDTTERSEMQMQLAQSDRLASVGVLAAGVAHEVNNPLVYILNNISYVLAHMPPEFRELGDALREARSGAERVRDIVKDLKTFSRSDDEKMQPIDARAVIDSAIKVAHNEIRHRAQLVRDYHTVPLVMANARLGQVFLNLLLNAAHSIAEGNADQNRITVSVSAVDDHVSIRVTDTGVGIPSDKLGRIFDPFFTTKPIGVGTGLGLSICKNITESLGGHLEVESRVGEGSVFTVFLPAIEGQVVPARPSSVPPPEVSKSLSVLVVDDDVFVARSIRRLLRPKHEVTLAMSGREALKLMQGHTYDLVFCDVMMPEMTGLELHRAVMDHDQELSERFVFITGGPFTPEARSLFGDVTNPWIQKPFTPADLTAVLEAAAARRSRTVPARLASTRLH